MPKRKLESSDPSFAEGEEIHISLVAEAVSGGDHDFVQGGRRLGGDTGPAVFMVEALALAEELAIRIWGQEAVDQAEHMIADALRRVEERNAS